MQKTPFYKRFTGSIFLAICLLQSASYAYAEKDWAEIRTKAEQGDAKSQLSLASRYEDGDGVVQNYKQSVAWSRKAAEQGDAHGQYNLGYSYFNGKGVAKDEKQAFAWFSKAAEQGESAAQAYLGIMYSAGIGVKKDNSLAYVWSAVAVANGFDAATDSRNDFAALLSQPELDAAQELAGLYFEKFPKPVVK